MKGNYESLTTFAAEIERIQATAKDYRVPAKNIRMTEDKSLILSGIDGEFGLKDYAHGQLADKVGIPRTYYDKLSQIPGLRTANVNAWLDHGASQRTPASYMVRTLDGLGRAFLSSAFRPIDNAEILSAILPTIQDLREKTGEIKVHSSGLTDEKMFVQILFPGVSGEVNVGDVVQAGVTITNSEIGAGTFQIEGLVYRLVCKNGMIGSKIIGQRHVGRRIGADENDYRIFKTDTIRAEHDAYRKIVRDVFADAMRGDWFRAELDKMKAAAEDAIVSPVRLSQALFKEKIMTEQDSRTVLMNLGGNDKTRWGLVNSITAMAHDVENPAQQYHYESLGNTILNLPCSQWERIAS